MSAPARRTTVTVTGLRSSREGGVARVSAEVDGTEVWFESAQLPLEPAAEGLGTAFLIPALLQGRTLEIEHSVSPRWLASMEAQVRTLHQWWGVPAAAPRVPGASAAPGSPAPLTALCFSGGVDSFHALLRSTEPIGLLVMVHGFDIPLSDRARLAAFESSLHAIASELAVSAAVVSTNLREHPLYRATPWERTHGGALVGIGHLLHGRVGRLLVSSSISRYSRHTSWGSHWTIDPRWSSERLEVANVGSEWHRNEKLRSIAHEPLVQRHLRVCWENREATGNCSRCEKCLQAMLVLSACGVLDRCEAFEGADPLAERLRALPRLDAHRGAIEYLAAHERWSPPVAEALDGLIRRTRAASHPWVRARRALVGRLLGLWGGRRA